MNKVEIHAESEKGDVEERSEKAVLKIAALIPTFNRAASLRKCLLCLQHQVFTEFNAIVIPVVVVDGSTDNTVAMLKTEFPGVTIVMGSGDWWYTRCINEGIRAALNLESDFILTLNDDLEFDGRLLETLLRNHFQAGDLAIVGSVSLSSSTPRVITFSGVSKIDFFLKETNYIPKFSPVTTTTLSGTRPSLVLSGRGILYPAEVFHLLGLYDERLVQYSSETDFTYRASEKGIPVLISYDAHIFENVKMTSGGAVYNNPSFSNLMKSFTNKYSINSFQKTWYYAIKHRGSFAGSLVALVRTLGVFKNFIQVKLRPKT
jgi:GT2 family glycosyltransferase